MKKLLCCCSLVLGLVIFVKPEARAICNGFLDHDYCCKDIPCANGYTCQQRKYLECCDTGSGCNPCAGWSGSSSCGFMAKKPAAKSSPLAKAGKAPGTSRWMTKLLDAIATPAHATNCWSGGNNFGVRNGAIKTDANGTSKNCEAKLHVCYTSGDADSAIPCTVSTTGQCDNACNNSNSPSQVACSYSDCQSRCYAARVSGYSDTCQ